MALGAATPENDNLAVATAITAAPAVQRSQQRPLPNRVIVGTAVSLIALVGCAVWASKQGAPRLPDSMGSWLLLALAIPLYAVVTLIRGVRWGRILNAGSIEHRRADACGVLMIGYMGNTALPARGGELMRIVLMSERSSGRRREILGSLVAERVLDGLVLASLFGLLVIMGEGRRSTGILPAMAALLVPLVAVAAGTAYLRLRRAGRLRRLGNRVRPVLGPCRSLKGAEGLRVTLLTLLIWLLDGSVMLLVGQSLNVQIGFGLALFVVVLSSLAGVIPAGPGYLGTFDAAALYALHSGHVRGGAAVGAVILERLVVFGPLTLAGLVLLVSHYGGLSALWHSSPSESSQ